MTAQVDEATVHQFLEIIHSHAGQVINGIGPGLMQLCRIHPDDESVAVSRYTIGDVGPMGQTRSPLPMPATMSTSKPAPCAKSFAATSAAGSKTRYGCLGSSPIATPIRARAATSPPSQRS